jgi:hypothetical protein
VQLSLPVCFKLNIGITTFSNIDLDQGVSIKFFGVIQK